MDADAVGAQTPGSELIEFPGQYAISTSANGVVARSLTGAWYHSCLAGRRSMAAGFAFAGSIAASGAHRGLRPARNGLSCGMASCVSDVALNANASYLLGSSAGFTYVIAKGPWPWTCTTVSSDAQA